MSVAATEMQAKPHWTIEEAEEFLSSLTAVLSARIIAGSGGEIEEIHALTTDQVAPKQTVRNVESGLLAKFDLTLDHRKISVAQTSLPIPSNATVERPMSVVIERSIARGEERILFRSHRLESKRPHGIRITVSVEWRGRTYTGMADAADLPRNRVEATAEATLRAVETAVSEAQHTPAGEEAAELSLSLDGVKPGPVNTKGRFVVYWGYENHRVPISSDRGLLSASARQCEHLQSRSA